MLFWCPRHGVYPDILLAEQTRQVLRRLLGFYLTTLNKRGVHVIILGIKMSELAWIASFLEMLGT